MKSDRNTRFLWGFFFISCLVVLLYHYVYGHIIVPKEGIDKQWHEYVDVVYYINLDEDVERKRSFLEEMRRMGVPEEKLSRIPAVKKPGKEEWGKSLSHMIAMELLLDTKHENCIVFEDGFVFKQDLKIVNEMFTEVFNGAKNYDVVMLSATEMESKPTNNKYMKKVVDAEGSSGYMVNKYYAQPLFLNFREGAKTIERSYDAGISPEKTSQFRLDKYWKRLQPQSNWYSFSPKLG